MATELNIDANCNHTIFPLQVSQSKNNHSS